MTRRTSKVRRKKACHSIKQSISLVEPPKTDEESQGIIERSVTRSELTYESFVKHLTQTAFSSLCVWSESDLSRLLLAAERLELDPLNGEIYALQSNDDPTSPVLLVVSVNGWARILNAHKAFDGIDFEEAAELTDGIPNWIACTIHRKDRNFPTTVREYLCEVKGENGAWLTHPRRMLRHKAMVQCARVSFGLVGIYDHDEATKIRQAQSMQDLPTSSKSATRTSIRTRQQPSSNAAIKSAIRSL